VDFVSSFILLIVSVTNIVPSVILAHDVLTPPYEYHRYSSIQIPSILLTLSLYTSLGVLTFTSAIFLLKRKVIGGILAITSCLYAVSLTFTVPLLLEIRIYDKFGVLMLINYWNFFIALLLAMFLGLGWSSLRK